MQGRKLESQFCLKKMASFEVAEQGPTLLFESQSLCDIFDICLSACMHVCLCAMCMQLIVLTLCLHVQARVPTDVCVNATAGKKKNVLNVTFTLVIYNFTPQC